LRRLGSDRALNRATVSSGVGSNSWFIDQSPVVFSAISSIFVELLWQKIFSPKAI
jgi:hypothetical protein